MIAEKTIYSLEFNKIREILQKFAVSRSGKNKILQMMPEDNINQINILLDEVYQADKILFEYTESPDFSFDDISEIVDKADKNVTLSMGELLKIARVMKISRLVADTIGNINSSEIELIKDYANMLFADILLENDIYKSILGENEMADTASSELKRIRDAITKNNITIKNKLQMFVSSPTYNKYLQDSIVTIRNNRFVIPVKSEYKNNIPGLIHDQSASGKAVFVEPFQIVQLNNEIATLRINESLEIEKILKQFTIRVGGEADSLRQNFDVLTDLDVIFAKALYAHSLKAERPQVNNNGEIAIIKGRHPLIDKDKVVPISLAIEGKKRLLMITGPNTGGKTVTLKLIGLFSIMAMCGIFPPCEYGSKIAVFEQIFSDIGDEQSIEQSLSTFSSHLVNIIDITNSADSKTLVLIDELGAGTDPIEGASLALAVTEKLVDCGGISVITTHYQQMKEYALTHDIVECASMDFDPITFAPTYRLLLGSTGSSNAIQIAERLGLNKSIVNRAKSLLSEDKVQFDAIILSAEKARRQAEEEKNQIEQLKIATITEYNVAREARKVVENERQKLNDTMRLEAKKILQDYLDEADEAIEKIKKIAQNPTEQGLFEARKLKSKLNKLSYEDESSENIQEYDNTPIKVGDDVYITSLDKTAVVVEDDKRKAEYKVKIGLMTTSVKYGKVKKIRKSDKNHTQSQSQTNVVINKPLGKDALPLECNVIGKRVDEALQIVEKYLDSAVLRGMHEVRIVHGKGSGALRTAIHDYFKTHPSIATFRLGKYGEGEWGVTIAELK